MKQRRPATHLRQALRSLESWWSNTPIRHNGSKTWLGLMGGLPSWARLHQKETGVEMKGLHLLKFEMGFWVALSQPGDLT
jgi:hypothetical protein